MSEWREVLLGDACSRLRSGSNITAKNIHESGDFPVFGGNGIRGYTSEPNFIGECAIIGRQGAYCGNVRYFRGSARMSEHAVVACATNENDTRFLAYALSTMNLGRLSGQAAQPGLSVKVLAKEPVLLPSLSTQQKISAMVGVFDDLIENNRRRIELLESMARAIYREWFVHFRFPGHEDVPMVDSDLGPIPEGWVASTCGQELNFIGGGTPSKKVDEYWNEATIPWYTPSDLTKDRNRYSAPPELCINELGVAKSSAKLFPAGSVMMTSRATLGVLVIATTPATTNQGFIVVLPDERWSSGFVREWLASSEEELAAIGTGATFKEITKGAFKRFPFIIPEQSILDAYREATDPLERQIASLEQRSRSLAAMRDVLLPKLVSGEIDVSGLDLDNVIDKDVVISDSEAVA